MNAAARWCLRVARALRILAPTPMSGDAIPLRYSTRLDPGFSVWRSPGVSRAAGEGRAAG